MEFKKVREESYESIQKYLETLLDVSDSIQNLSFVTVDGIKYLVSSEGERVGIVKNDGNTLTAYYLCDASEEMPHDFYATTNKYYRILRKEVSDDTFVEVIKNTLGEDEDLSKEESLLYMPRIENFPRDIISYEQRVNNASFEMKYDVTERSSIISGVNYTKFHTPDQLISKVTRSRRFGSKVRETHFLKALNEEFYYKPIIATRNFAFGAGFLKYPTEELLAEIALLGFNKKIPEDLYNLLTDEDKNYKTLRLIAHSYNNYLKQQ